MKFGYNSNHRSAVIVLGLVSACALSLAIIFATFDAFEDALFDNGGAALLYASSNISNSMASLLVSISQVVVAIISNLGYPGIFFLMFLESTSVPIPSEVVLPFSGYLASIGRFEVWAVILISTIAGVAGSLVDYYIGAKAVTLRQSRFLSRFLDNKETKKQLERAERWFERHGGKAVFFTRMIPGVRTFVSFPAGASRMSLTKFTFYTALGCFLWSVLLVYLGVYLGDHWFELFGIVHYAGLGALVALVTGIVLWAAFLERAKRRRFD